MLVHKKNEDDQFMIETTCSARNEDVVALIVQLYNGRVKLELLADELEKVIDQNTKKTEEEDEKQEKNDYSSFSLGENQRIALDRIINDLRLFLSKVRG